MLALRKDGQNKNANENCCFRKKKKKTSDGNVGTFLALDVLVTLLHSLLRNTLLLGAISYRARDHQCQYICSISPPRNRINSSFQVSINVNPVSRVALILTWKLILRSRRRRVNQRDNYCEENVGETARFSNRRLPIRELITSRNDQVSPIAR